MPALPWSFCWGLPELRPAFELKGKMTALSMNLVIQMMMLIAGAVMLMACKVNASAISNGAVFKAGMVAIFSVFGVAWMSDTFSVRISTS